MGLCWRSSPLVALVLIVGHVTSWFGIAPAHHHSSSRGYEYADARTGRPVDRSGRRIYQV